MARQITNHRHWFFCVGALALWLAQGWPVLEALANGGKIRGVPVPDLWLVPFLIFGATVLAAMTLRLRASFQWALLSIELAAVLAMAAIVQWAGMSAFLAIIAWQAALVTSPGKAIGWAVFQTLALIGALALTANPDLCWVITKSFALQLLLVFTAQAVQREAESARALAETNRQLRAAQAIIANTVRDAERLRISRELHDAWGHELTALGLQLEIASHVVEPGRGNDHVVQAKGLARSLLAKVRDVVSTLRDTEHSDLRDALDALAHSVPSPAVHVEMASGVQVGPEQAHALIRCAQEAVTNAVRHSSAANLWLQVTADRDGVRLVAHNDGTARRAAAAPGNGLVGMRERIETLGGRLAVRMEAGIGFTVDAWLPSSTPRTA
ncbi:sensor histidine kinase [Sphingoaurantiacus capsulatus]|uniref:Sensor histidine kinase n=1 Tax=Sphingoaurantiacus capsulatus TaxID=1771310 RepID=A0ABV7XD48_9SPHN